MANSGILSEFEPASVKAFEKDFARIMKIGFEIDKYYGMAHHFLDAAIPKYDGLLGQFNRKYKGIKIITKKSIEEFELKIYVEEKSMKDFFANSASRIPGLKSVGKTNFNQIEVGNAASFAAFLDSMPESIYFSYADSEEGASTVAAILDRGRKSIEIVYSPSEITSAASAGFKICAFYALKHGYSKKINVYSESLTFGFSSLLNEVEKVEWNDRFRQH